MSVFRSLKMFRSERFVLLGVLLLMTTLPNPLTAEEPYDWPLDEPTYLTSTFAEYRGSHLHNGIDFSTGQRIGLEVQAVDSGQLSRVFFDPDLYGKTVVLKHDDGRRTWYSHLSRLDPSVSSVSGGPIGPGEDRSFEDGKFFEQGQRIAFSGRTGRGPAHLHLAVEGAEGSFLNPMGRFHPPLSFGVKTKIKYLILHPLTGKTWINGQGKSVSLNGASNRTVQLWGTVGIDLTLWNEHKGRNTRSLPSRIRVYRDGELVRELQFDRLERPDQDTGVHWLFDRQKSNLSPTQFTLHLTPTETHRWKGLQFRDRGQSGTLKFVVETRNGTSHTESLPYEVVPPPKKIKWNHQQLRPKNRDQVDSVQDVGSGFRLAALQTGQFAREQYSPPSRDDKDEPSLRLETRRGVNRIRVDLEIRNRWEGWPRVQVRGETVDTELSLYQIEPGQFVGIWSPELSRDGWYHIEADLPSEESADTVSRRLYLQSVRPEEPGSVLSRDGRFSIFSPGSGLTSGAFVTVDTVPKKSLRSELRYVESPREVRPGWLQSRKPFEITVNLSDLNEVREIGLYQWDSVQKRWNVLSHREGLTSFSRKARIYDPGLLALLRDEQPPRVESVHYKTKIGQIEVNVAEKGSGVDPDQLEVSTDRGTLPAYWDADGSRIVVPDVSSAEGNRRIELSVADRAGNRTEWSGSVR